MKESPRKNVLRIITSLMHKAEKLDTNAYTLSVVSIIKNEAAYIEEWLKYHIIAGVDHFYLYDNGSTDNTVDLLIKYIDAGLVTLTEFPGQGQQLPVYNDALKRFKAKTKYMAFIDADEFLFSCEKDKSVKQEVEELFTLYPDAGGLAINWRMFGSSGHVTKPRGGVLENYLYRANEDGKGNDCIKTVVNPRLVYCYAHPHYPTYYVGYSSVDEDGQKVEGWSHTMNGIKRLRINHYFTKSKEEWIVRRSIGKVDRKDRSDIRTIDEFYEHDNNDIYDAGMLSFVGMIEEFELKRLNERKTD